MNKHLVGVFVGLCLLLAPAVRAAAAGGGIPAGPALLFPTLAVTETYDDNIGLQASGEQSDWLTSVAPALRVVLPVRRFFLNAEGGLDFRSYRDADGENSTDWFAGAAVGGEFPGGLSFRVSDRYAETYQVSSEEFGPGENTTLNTLKATVNYAIRDALRLELSGTGVDRTFDRTLARDRVETTLKTALYWKFRPSLSALAELSFADFSYGTATVQDGSATQAALGVNWDVTAKSTGFAKAGYQWKRYDDEDQAAGTEDASYYTVSAGMRNAFTRRTTLVAELTRSSEESDFSGNPYYLRTSIGAALSQRFTAKIYGRAGLTYQNDEYPNETTLLGVGGLESGKRTDSTLNGSVAVGFDVTRWLALELAYGGERRSSDFDTFDYAATRVSLSAKAAF